MTILSRFEGAFFGLAVGDALGAPFEGGPIERVVWRIIGRTRDGKRRWTDDTQMSLDVASSLIANRQIDQSDIAARFSASYRWSRGYGRGAAKVLKKIRNGMSWETANRSAFPDGSYGNGAAMRSPIVGLFCYRAPTRIDEAAKKVAEITHAHPLAIEGARLVAHATAKAVSCSDAAEVWDTVLALDVSSPFAAKLNLAANWVNSTQLPTLDQIRNELGNGIAATDSVVTSLFVGLSHSKLPFDELIDTVNRLRGDTDTIAAMAGSIWGALRGIEEIPSRYQHDLEDELLVRKTAADLLDLASIPAEK